MTTVNVFAPAKINLTLHVTGRREDGYHLLDSLVAFADVGDTLLLRNISATAEHGAKGTFSVVGLESAGVPEDESNLVRRAIDMMVSDVAPWVQLEKNLPAASGIGGGSSDAAAAIRGFAQAWQTNTDNDGATQTLRDLGQKLGADVPMCIDPRPWRAEGIGTELTPVELPQMDAILVNPRIEVPTAQVFDALQDKQGEPMKWPPQVRSVAELCRWLHTTRNDLEAPAKQVAPAINHVLERLEALPGVLIARMSGSGATCFAIFESSKHADEAAQIMQWHEPDWWVRSVKLGNMSKRAVPREVAN